MNSTDVRGHCSPSHSSLFISDFNPRKSEDFNPSSTGAASTTARDEEVKELLTAWRSPSQSESRLISRGGGIAGTITLGWRAESDCSNLVRALERKEDTRASRAGILAVEKQIRLHTI
jgi:hypothetical protein